MLFKSMGIDPAEIQKSISMFGEMVLDIKNQMNRIEAKLDAVLTEKEHENDGPENSGTEIDAGSTGETN